MKHKPLYLAVAAALSCTSVAGLAATPVPEAQQERFHALADHNKNGLSGGLEAALAEASPNEKFRVVVVFNGPGNATSAQHAVGAFDVHQEFRIVPGFAATMSAAQIRALSKVAGVFRIEEDFKVTANMDAARHDFGIDAVHATPPYFDGTGVGICVIDTGIDKTHEQLDNGKVVDFVDCTKPTLGRCTVAAAYDDQGHGTHVSSIAAGGGGPESASADKYKGVAPGASLYGAKVLDANGRGYESTVIAGVEWCANHPGVRVLSLSLGSGTPSDGQDTLSTAVNNAVNLNGKVVVVAAGNDGDALSSVGSPGAAKDVITVGACAEYSAPVNAANHDDGIYLAPWSSRGPIKVDQATTRTKPDICSPGIGIAAAQANSRNHAGYVVHSGTSMATPFVSGTVALMLDAKPTLFPVEVQAIIEKTAYDMGPDGKDNDWGAGLLDGAAAVSTAANPDQPPLVTQFPINSFVSDSVADGSTRRLYFTVEDATKPIAATIMIDGQVGCVPYFGIPCFFYQWDPDLDARILTPSGALLAQSTCAAGDECGNYGRQETPHAMPTIEQGQYTLEVWRGQDEVNLGKGGAFTVELSNGTLSPMVLHVSDLDRTSINVPKSSWKGTVTITVQNADGAPVQMANVYGKWSNGYTGTPSCTTDAAGTCSVTTGSISRGKPSVTFAVTNVTGVNADYNPAANTDGDGDSDGTTIVVYKP